MVRRSLYNPHILELEFAEAKMVAQCDNCKMSIDLKKPPKPPKGQKAKSNPSIQATLETGTDTGETKDFHFCDEECLRMYLNKRNKK